VSLPKRCHNIKKAKIW